MTLPPIILNAGAPLIKVSRANIWPHSGQVQGTLVLSSTIRSLKHLTKAPLPPLRYLNSWVLHLAQKISTVREGPFLFGFAIFRLFQSRYSAHCNENSRIRLKLTP